MDVVARRKAGFVARLFVAPHEILFRFLHQLSESIFTRKEIDDMELVIQLILFVCGEVDPLGTEPASGG